MTFIIITVTKWFVRNNHDSTTWRYSRYRQQKDTAYLASERYIRTPIKQKPGHRRVESASKHQSGMSALYHKHTVTYENSRSSDVCLQIIYIYISELRNTWYMIIPMQIKKSELALAWWLIAAPKSSSITIVSGKPSLAERINGVVPVYTVKRSWSSSKKNILKAMLLEVPLTRSGSSNCAPFSMRNLAASVRPHAQAWLRAVWPCL